MSKHCNVDLEFELDRKQRVYQSQDYFPGTERDDT